MLPPFQSRTRRRPLSRHTENDENAARESFNIRPLFTPESPNVVVGLPLGQIKEGQSSILSKVLADTPPRLRELEQGWKNRRRRVVEEVSFARSRGDDRRPILGTTDDTIGRRFRRRPSSLDATRKARVERKDGAKVEGPLTEKTAKRPQKGTNNVRFESSTPSALPTPPNTPPLPENTLTPATRTSFSRQRDCSRQRCEPESGPADLDVHAKIDHAKLKSSSSRARPILAKPLPPSHRPVPITSKGRSTIYMAGPNEGIEMRVALPEDQVVRINKGGEVVVFTRERNDSGVLYERTLRLPEIAQWGKSDEQAWVMIQRIVEEFKRHTPRVKLFDPLGHLTVTCSSPPDIILSFYLDTLPWSVPERRDRSASPSRLALAASRDELNDQGTNIKVRLVYSRSTSEIRIDTSLVKPSKSGSKQAEKLRTKRIVPLSIQSALSDCIEASTMAQFKESLGLNSKLHDWLNEEKEGLRRLWDLRQEWTKWDAG
ncbi:hypothetical protein CI109_105747 [Kwoniella shandongensis]|uniref:Uncharacterized protein n=1 Tax=Kwoniella shandongensis TaxID=1734106 RepID=A0A5M6C4Z9_9TREE|nr:uncharacterized protein CI109_003087 [Kwoniella shandongensis]KAA5528555.1 hypothetical protein CI109_003087 [Kwoniella shandongensis]